MTHLSKRVLDKDIEKYLIDSLSALIANTNGQKESRTFLIAALTETERKMIAKRLVAAFFLRHNISQAEICEQLKLTPATLGKFRLWVKLNQEGFDSIFTKLEKERAKNITKQIFYKLLDYAIRASSGNIRSIVKL